MRAYIQKIFCFLFCLCCTTLFACQTPQPQPSLPNSNVTIYPPSTPAQQPVQTWTNPCQNVDCISKERKLIALTFDDAPGKTLENILAVFAAYNEQNPDCLAFSTIFFNSQKISSAQLPLLQAAYSVGFELGNHTATHANLSTLTPQQVRQEIDDTDQLLSRIDNSPRHLFRAPFGVLPEHAKPLVNAPIIDWTIDTLDWTGISEQAIISSVLSNKFNGAIVLFHDGYTPTVSALKTLLPALKAEGYQAVTISQMAKMHGVQMKNGSVYIRLRPTKNGKNR